jgi:hypothetical protein
LGLDTRKPDGLCRTRPFRFGARINGLQFNVLAKPAENASFKIQLRQAGNTMHGVMPSQVVQTIDELFPHAAKNSRGTTLNPGQGSQLLAILNLLKSVPDELINPSFSDYADLVVATSTIEEHLAIWRSRGPAGDMAHVKGLDAITVIRRVLSRCADEYPPSSTTELLFIKDDELRDSIRRDAGAANRALNNAEWKAATVLAGATIEALLHWRLQESPPDSVAIQNAATDLVAAKKINKPHNDLDRWEVHHFIEVAAHLNLIKPDTSGAARLAQNFRNLIHPGRAARLAQTCDRATAYSAIGAMEHVIRDLT